MDFQQGLLLVLLGVGALVVGRVVIERMKAGKGAKPSGGPVAPSAPSVVAEASSDFGRASEAITKLLRTVARWDIDEVFGDIFQAAAAGDWSNVFSFANQRAKDLENDKQALTLFERGFFTQLTKRLDDDEQFRRIAKLVDDRRHAVAESAKNTIQDRVFAPAVEAEEE